MRIEEKVTIKENNIKGTLSTRRSGTRRMLQKLLLTAKANLRLRVKVKFKADKIGVKERTGLQRGMIKTLPLPMVTRSMRLVRKDLTVVVGEDVTRISIIKLKANNKSNQPNLNNNSPHAPLKLIKLVLRSREGLVH